MLEEQETENRKITELASRFDSLPSAGYDNILQVLTSKVNGEIAEATRTPLDPETQRIHVIRWNAMRELLDEMVNHVTSTQDRRDEIEQERRHLAEMNAIGEAVNVNS